MDNWSEFEFDGRRLEVDVFGIAGALNAQAAGLVFSLVIFTLVLLEIAFSKAEDWASEHETNELFNKLKKELTMLGIVSFLTFIYTSATNITSGKYYEAFEMSHIVILFIAFSVSSRAEAAPGPAGARRAPRRGCTRRSTSEPRRASAATA